MPSLLHATALLAALGLPAPAWLAGLPTGRIVALGERAGRVLAGTESGLYLENGEGWSLVHTRGGVRDIASGPDGTWIAAGVGLYVWPRESARPRLMRIAAGASVNGVDVDSSGTVWVATEVGLFSRPAGAAGFERAPGLPAGSVRSVRANDATHAVWIAGPGGAVHVRRGGGAFEVALAAADPGWWELLDVVASGPATLVCVPRGLWLFEQGVPRRIELGIGTLAGMARLGDDVWLAAERGAFRIPVGAVGLSGAPQAALAGPALDLVAGGTRLVVATRRGVAALAESARGAVAELRSAGRGRPPIDRIHRAVLRYLELEPARMRVLEARARRAPLYPTLRATFAGGTDRARSRDHDQTFSSGEVRDLFDRDRTVDSGLELQLQLTWDLDELVAPDRAIAISRERRELVELRDQVLDRVNRLYFERERVLARLAATDVPAAGEPAAPTAPRAELELRAAELAAGLDAWSGGLFSRIDAGGRPNGTTSPPQTGTNP